MYIKQRESGIELLRILAMFLVLIYHSNMWSLEYIFINDNNIYNNANSYIPTILSINVIEGVSKVCVNLFVLISGYFGIKLSIKRILSFLFQCFFIVLLGWIYFFVSSDHLRISIGIVLQILTSWFSSSWFIQSYLLLMLFSPILNTFVEHTSCKMLKMITCILLLLCLMNALIGVFPNYSNGYSFDFLVSLYIIGAYIKKEKKFFIHISVKKLLTIYVFVLFLYVVVSTCYNLLFKIQYSTGFNDPFIIVLAIVIFCCFIRINFINKVVNFIARCTFAVYLLHTSIIIKPIFQTTIQKYYCEYNGVLFVINVFIYLVFVFTISIMLDILRQYIWALLSKRKIELTY